MALEIRRAVRRAPLHRFCRRNSEEKLGGVVKLIGSSSCTEWQQGFGPMAAAQIPPAVAWITPPSLSIVPHLMTWAAPDGLSRGGKHLRAVDFMGEGKSELVRATAVGASLPARRSRSVAGERARIQRDDPTKRGSRGSVGGGRALPTARKRCSDRRGEEEWVRQVETTRQRPKVTS